MAPSVYFNANFPFAQNHIAPAERRHMQQQGLSLSQAVQAYPERSGTEDIYISTYQAIPQTVLNAVDNEILWVRPCLNRIQNQVLQ